MKVNHIILKVSLLLSLTCLPKVWAGYSFSPIKFEMTTKGAGSTRIGEVANRGKSPVAIKVRVTQRLQKLDGTENRPLTEDIKVFPYQLLLQPNEVRNIKITWVGPKTLDMEKSYRILVEQVPVQFESKPSGNNITIMTNYSGSIYVSDKNSYRPQIELLSLKESKGALQLHLKNSGTKRQLFRNSELSLKCKDGKKHKIPTKSLGSVEGHHLLAATEIKYRISMPNSIKSCDIDKWEFTHE